MLTPEQERLVIEYSPFAKSVAVIAARSSQINNDDAVSAGYEGLVQAALRFDPDKGVKFKTYAYTRIYGSVIDQVRKDYFIPRSAHARGEKVEMISMDYYTGFDELACFGTEVASLWDNVMDFRSAFATLTQREKEVFVRLYAGQPVSEVADLYKVKKSRIYQIAGGAKHKIEALIK